MASRQRRSTQPWPSARTRHRASAERGNARVSTDPAKQPVTRSSCFNCAEKTNCKDGRSGRGFDGGGREAGAHAVLEADGLGGIAEFAGQVVDRLVKGRWARAMADTRYELFVEHRGHRPKIFS